MGHSSKFYHVLTCPATQLSQQTPLRRWQISILMPSCLSRYCCLHFLLSIAPRHRFSLQNGDPVFPLILTPKQTTLEETIKSIGLSYRISLPQQKLAEIRAFHKLKYEELSSQIMSKIGFFFANFIHFKDENQIKATIN